MKRFNKLPKTPQGIHAVKEKKDGLHVINYLKRMQDDRRFILTPEQIKMSNAVEIRQPDKIADYEPVKLSMLD